MSLGQDKHRRVAKGFKGKAFYKLVESHLDRHKYKTEQIQKAVLGTTLFLSPDARPLAMDFIDRWNGAIYDSAFWQTGTDLVFDSIIEDAGEVLGNHGVEADDETLFNMFQIVVLSYAYSASNQPKMQEFIGIKRRTLFR